MLVPDPDLQLFGARHRGHMPRVLDLVEEKDNLEARKTPLLRERLMSARKGMLK